MATKVAMPKLGLVMTEGVVVQWLKDDGQPVKKGEQIAVIMSKKITYKVESPADGVLRHVARVKQTVPCGQAMAFVTAPGEAIPAEAEVAVAAAPIAPAAAAVAPTAPTPGVYVAATPAARRLAKELNVELDQVQGSGPEGRVTEADVRRFAEERARPVEILASPAAKKLARDYGLDLAQIPGTGPGGRVTEKDVQAFFEAQQRAAPITPAPAVARTIPFLGMRQMIAQRMTESLQTMAQVTASTEVDVTETVKLREQIKTKFDLTYTDIIIKAVTSALKEHPRLNSALISDEIQLLEEMHIGVAVALEDGLIVPVVRNADRLTLAEIARETRRLAESARAGTLTVDEATGSTFTITNLGMFGIDTSTPIINPPEVAILGVGRIIEKPAVFQGEIAKRSMMALSLTFDHRIVDGAPAAAFLRTLAGLLEKPYLLFV
jgi:pyruvate dehydrogenase E2 component (dihydrolipoamide acetyltransferase)